MTSQTLLLDVIELTRLNINEVEKLKTRTVEALNYRESENSWTALECIEHLNNYGRFYLPELQSVISKSMTQPSTDFKGSWLGRFFVKTIDPNIKTKKMNTPKAMNPMGTSLSMEALDVFLAQQHQLLGILDQAKSVNLDEVKTKIALSKLIKLRLGDTLKFLVLHNQRHINQANRILNSMA